MTISYRQQFDKLTAAYIANEVNPYDNCACFVGNLLDQTSEWANYRTFSSTEHSVPVDWCSGVSLAIMGSKNSQYTIEEVCLLENIFLDTIKDVVDSSSRRRNLISETIRSQFYEEALFQAFQKTLEVLKGIHETHGEKVDEDIPQFTKRQLACS